MLELYQGTGKNQPLHGGRFDEFLFLTNGSDNYTPEKVPHWPLIILL
jgi:hypothetical protein